MFKKLINDSVDIKIISLKIFYYSHNKSIYKFLDPTNIHKMIISTDIYTIRYYINTRIGFRNKFVVLILSAH